MNKENASDSTINQMCRLAFGYLKGGFCENANDITNNV